MTKGVRKRGEGYRSAKALLHPKKKNAHSIEQAL